MNVSVIPSEWRLAKRVSFGDIRRRLECATLSDRNAILRFIHENPGRIRPSIDDDWLYAATSDYLLECIARHTDSDITDASVHSPFEAARELVGWFNWIVAQDNVPTVIRNRIDRVASVFKNGGTSVQNCVETGFLEHVLETPSNRPYFSHWKDDEVLADCYTEALRWGEAHARTKALEP